MLDLPPLKSLRVFEACMRLGSFTRAAQELRVGQPAISHQIHALERDLGVQLFNRRGVRTAPTAEALLYYRSIAVALADMARATTALRSTRRPPGVTLATYPGLAMFWLLPRLAKLKQSHPKLRVRVTTAERDCDIPVDEVDCAILFGSGDWPGYQSYRLMTEVVVPVASPALAATLRGRPWKEILRGGPLIHLDDEDHRWFNWADWRDRRYPEVSELDAGIAVTNHGIAIHQALMGRGVALGWRGVIDDMLDNNLLVALDARPLSSDRGYFLVSRRTFPSSRLGKVILSTLPVKTAAG
jgi:DNA-binding transcriptional LysR family regulator